MPGEFIQTAWMILLLYLSNCRGRVQPGRPQGLSSASRAFRLLPSVRACRGRGWGSGMPD